MWHSQRRFNSQHTQMRAGYKTVTVFTKTITEPQMEDVMTKSLLQWFSQRHANPARLNLRRNKCPNNLTGMCFVLQSPVSHKMLVVVATDWRCFSVLLLHRSLKQMSYSDEHSNGSRHVGNVWYRWQECMTGMFYLYWAIGCKVEKRLW